MSGTLKKNTSQRIVWTHYENMLLELWEEKIEDLRGSRRNAEVYQEMATSMHQIGFPGTWADVRTKIDNLTRRYRQENSKIGPTVGAPWMLYKKVHNILGAYKHPNIETSMHERTENFVPSTSTKRSRVSQDQLSEMVNFMYEHPGFTGSKSLKYYGKTESDRIWRELAKVLNSLDGAVKTVEQWQVVWKDLKSHTSVKLRGKKAHKGNDPDSFMELEKRVMAIIERDDIESNDLENQFEYEEELSFDMPSTNLSETIEFPQSVNKRLRIEDDSETQQIHFQEIASKQADSLKTLTDSNAACAEIVRKQAETLKLLAECSAASLEAKKSMSEAIKLVCEGLKANADAINNLANAINRSENIPSLLVKRKRPDAQEANRQSIGVTYEETTPFESETGHSMIDFEDSPIIVKSETLNQTY